MLCGFVDAGSSFLIRQQLSSKVRLLVFLGSGALPLCNKWSSIRELCNSLQALHLCNDSKNKKKSCTQTYIPKVIEALFGLQNIHTTGFQFLNWSKLLCFAEWRSGPSFMAHWLTRSRGERKLLFACRTTWLSGVITSLQSSAIEATETCVMGTFIPYKGYVGATRLLAFCL